MSSKGERDNQLVSVNDYDVNRMIFSEPQSGSVPDTPIVYKRIAISTLNPDGSVGDLLLPTDELFSFGVSENIDPVSKKVNGHVLSLCLWDKTNPTSEQKAWTTTFDSIVERTKSHLLESKDEIEQYDLTANDLKKFNPLYWKREKGKIVEGTGPTLYSKLIASKKNNKIMSMFFTPDDQPIDPMTLLGKYCYVKAVIKIESIFIGSKITLQVKLYEATVRLVENKMKSLLSRPKNTGKLVKPSETKNSAPSRPRALENDNDNDNGSLQGSEDEKEDEEDTKPVKPVKADKKKSAASPPAAPARKIVKKVLKK